MASRMLKAVSALDFCLREIVSTVQMVRVLAATLGVVLVEHKQSR
jgi:hypothetical protein